MYRGARNFSSCAGNIMESLCNSPYFWPPCQRLHEEVALRQRYDCCVRPQSALWLQSTAGVEVNGRECFEVAVQAVLLTELSSEAKVVACTYSAQIKKNHSWFGCIYSCSRSSKTNFTVFGFNIGACSKKMLHNSCVPARWGQRQCTMANLRYRKKNWIKET